MGGTMRISTADPKKSHPPYLFSRLRMVLVLADTLRLSGPVVREKGCVTTMHSFSVSLPNFTTPSKTIIKPYTAIVIKGPHSVT